MLLTKTDVDLQTLQLFLLHRKVLYTLQISVTEQTVFGKEEE